MTRHSHHRRKKKKKKFLLLSVIGVLLLLCITFVWMDQQETRPLKEASTQETEEDKEPYTYNDHLSNYLFLGVDSREPVETYELQSDAGQADAIFLVSLNRQTRAVRVLSIPRDTMTQVETFTPAGKSLGKVKQHLNIQYAFGDGRHKSCTLMKEAVSYLLYDLPIQGYCSLNLDGIPLLAELAGGVEITVPDDILEVADPAFQQGEVVTLTKDNVETFVRYRDKTMTGSALARQEHQRIFLEAFMKKARELQSQDEGFVADMYQALEPYMVTNIGNDLFLDLLTATEEQEPQEYLLPGEGMDGDDHFEEYHVDEDALQELILELFYMKNS